MSILTNSALRARLARSSIAGWIGFSVLALAAAGANAQTCSTYPTTLANGTTADATQVMANFNCAALLGAAHFTGNVGVGTTVPAGTVDVERAANDGGIILRVGDADAGDTWSFDFIRSASTGALSIQGNQTAYNNIILAPSSGYVGIGTTAPTALLQVNGAASATAWNIVSDKRLKTDIKPIGDALRLVENLRGVRYRWRTADDRSVGKALDLPSNQPQIGFIAQEVEKVVPEAVTPPKQSGDVYTLQESKLIPVLVEAIKQQQAEIAELRSAIADLKSKIGAGQAH